VLEEKGGPHLLTLIVEGDHPNDGPEKFHAGINYGFEQTFFLRAGYRFNYDVQSFTFGVGLNYTIGTTFGTLNYAYLDFGVLKNVHMISLGAAL